MASSGSTCNVLYFFRRQLAGAPTIQHPVRRVLLQHDLLLFCEMIFFEQMGTDYEQPSMSLKRIVFCFNVSAGIFTIAIPRMGER
jgi:hypothetical protein